MTRDDLQNREHDSLLRLVESLAKDVKEIRQIVLHTEERVSDIVDETIAIRDTLATYELGSSYVPDGSFDFYANEDD